VAQLIAVGLPLNADWFMQNGATPHRVKVAFDLPIRPSGISYHYRNCRGCGEGLHAVMTFSVISLWLPLNISYSQSNPSSAMELSILIVDMLCDITEGVCRRVMRNVKVRVPEIVRQNENM
jgi:hypothetical protein